MLTTTTRDRTTWPHCSMHPRIPAGCFALTLLLSLTALVEAQTIDVIPAGDTVFVYSGFEGGPFEAQTPTTWTVEDVDNVGLELNVVSNQPWLVTTPASGTLPGRFRDSTLDVLAALDVQEAVRLAPGLYTAVVSFINLDTGLGNTERTVNLRVGAAHLSVSPAFVNAFAAQNAPSPTPVDVAVNAVGTTDLNYALSWVPRSWFTVDKTGGTVPGAGTDHFSVLFNSFGLEPDTYSAHITVENITNGAGTTHLPVSLTVSAASAGAVLLVPDADMEVRGVAGLLPPIRRESRLVNQSDRFVLWQASASDEWMSVSPAGGELAPGDQNPGGLDEQTLEVRTNLAANDLPAGSHVGTVTFENLTTGVPIATRVIRILADPVLTLPADAVGGVIEVSPTGVAVAEEPSSRRAFDFGAVVTLTAIANESYQFEAWVTDIQLEFPQDNPIVIPMDSSRTVGAIFRPILRTLTLSVSGEGTGTVKPRPSGTSVENTLVFRYTDGQLVTLDAQADAGSMFAGWAGNVPSGEDRNNPLEMLMDRDRTITAKFEPVVTLSVKVTGNGAVAVDPDLATFAAGTVVTLTAEPADAFEFAGWEGDADGFGAVLTVTLDTSKTIEAIFVPEGSSPGVAEFMLFVDVVGDGVVSPSGGEFEADTTVTLIATPGIGSLFLQWEGDASGTGLTTTVLLDKSRSVRAVFETDPSAERPVDGGNAPSARLCGTLGWASLSMLGLSWATLTRARRRR